MVKLVTGKLGAGKLCAAPITGLAQTVHARHVCLLDFDKFVEENLLKIWGHNYKDVMGC